MSLFAASEDLPNYVRPEVKAYEKRLCLVHDLLEGTERMHDQSTVYIRKWRDEDQSVYDIRRKCEELFEGLSRTLSAATGMLFAIPPVVTWNAGEALIKSQWDNIDAAGTKGTVFAKRFTNNSLADGIGAILVDHTPAPKGVVVTSANENALGLRPTWAMYHRQQVINWRSAVINGMRTLTLIVLKEVGEEDAGLYGVRPVTRFRVIRLVPMSGGWVANWTLYRQVKDVAASVDAFAVEGSGFFRNRLGDLCPRIPVSIAYTGTTNNILTSSVPLMGVANANLSHWQLATNVRFYRDLAAFPQPTITGALMQEPGRDTTGQSIMVPGRMRLGPVVVVHLAENGKFEWTEIKGESLNQLDKALDDKIHAMSMLGMSFLTKDIRGVQTAEAKRLDATAENSTLSTSAQGIEDAVNDAFELHAWYLGIPKEGAPVAAISRDYESTVMDPQTMIAYVTAVKEAGLPLRLLLQAWKDGGRLSPDTDVAALEVEMMSNIAAAASAKADAAAAANAGAGNDVTAP